MGCRCGGGSASGGAPTQYKVTGMDGQTYGPYLTAVEGRIKLQEIGGGTMTPVPAPQ